MRSIVRDEDGCSATLLDAQDADDNARLRQLRNDPRIEFVDTLTEQSSNLHSLRPAPTPELTSEAPRWAYYPWRRTVVGVLGPHAFRAVRLDRNRNLITADEQDRLGRLRIGIIGLSVGHVIAHTLAAAGLCGELRLADFDSLDLSNLNRVPATVLDLGVNKAVAAARRIAELDPYLHVCVMRSGLTPDNVDGFLDGLDIVVEECDSLDVKILVREAARARALPVVMATSDRGLVDIERYDLEPDRPILHGLLGDVDVTRLAELTNREKIPYVLRVLDGSGLSPRGAASLVEVGHTLSTWPQLAGDVALGATAVAEAVRRIGIGEQLPSGRVRIDVTTALGRVAPPTGHETNHPSAEQPHDTDERPHTAAGTIEIVTAAAIRAPSGGNTQPWSIEAVGNSIIIRLAPEHTSTMDIGLRGSAVAIGAAAFNARVAAAAEGALGCVTFDEGDGRWPLNATLQLGDGADPELARLYEPMLLRETNRRLGAATPLPAETITTLRSAAQREGGSLRLLTGRDEIARAAAIFADSDRVRYLTPPLHADMMSELRWPGDPTPESGIDVRSLELDPGGLRILDMLRRPDVMAQLANWDAGTALGADIHARVSASSALAVVTVRGHALTDYARGGSAVEAVWIVAQHHGLAVQPISPVFLYAHGDDDLKELSSGFADELHRMQRAFRELTHTESDESHALVLRFSTAPRASVRSRRREP